MRKKYRIWLIVLVVLLFIGWIYWGEIMDRNIELEFDRFYKSDINGRIDMISTKYHGTLMKMKDGNKIFLFYPITDKLLNDGKIFNYFAQHNDYVQKPAFSDTLLLIKSGKKYVYLFKTKF